MQRQWDKLCSQVAQFPNRNGSKSGKWYQQIGITSSEVLGGEEAAALNGFVEGSQRTWLLPTPNTKQETQ